MTLQIRYCPDCGEKLHNYAYWHDDRIGDFRTDYQCSCGFDGFLPLKAEDMPLRTKI